MLGVSFSLGSSSLWRKAHGSALKATLSAVFLGQSEIHYLFNTGPFWNNLGIVPLPPEPNLIFYPYDTSGLPDGIPVTTASVTAGDVSQSMGVLSAFLAHAAPGVQFVVGSAANSGTGRGVLSDDSIGSRAWSSTANTIAAIERDYGKVDTMIECWYNADAARMNNFRNNFWPLYFGVNGDGSPFTLGDSSPYNGAVSVDHCFWDALAPVDEKGRGILSRSETNWRILTPMPFWNAPRLWDPTNEYNAGTRVGFNGNMYQSLIAGNLGNEPSGDTTSTAQWGFVRAELNALNFSEYTGRLSEPSRAVMIGLQSNEIAQSVSLEVGPSAHMCWFPTGNSIHPNTQDPDGQVLFMWPFALAMLRQAGFSIGEPTIVGVEGPETGEYADLIVDLPNGGNLTTLRQFRDEPFPAERSDHQQVVTGFEIDRGGLRRPVFRADQTSYDPSVRGTVEIIDTGSGSPRRGRVRITPTEVFRLSDSVSYLRGQATGGLFAPRDRDNRLYMDMLMEHIPGFYDSGATYRFEGIPVRPVQEEIVTPSTVTSGEVLNVVEDYSTFPHELLSAQEGWAVDAGQSLVISSGVLLRQAAFNNNPHRMIRTEDWPPDQEVTLTYQNRYTGNQSSRMLVHLRRSAAGNFYELSLRRGGGWRVDRVVGGTVTTLETGEVDVFDTMTARFRVMGERLSVWINGTQVADVTDTGTTVLAGKPAIEIFLAGPGGSHAVQTPDNKIFAFAASNAF